MKPFQCRFCYKHFKSIQGLDSHVNRHIEKNVYVCSICSKQYFHETSLRSHLEAKKCSRQNKSYNRFAKYDAKTDVYNFLGYIYYTEALQCKHCKKVFCSEKKYFKHEKKHKKPFGCNECRTSFLNAKKLRSHYVSHHIFQ
uniref:C2H2-type domain-containing protein n=1 Tax=Ciona intestinalis TaxID=7719 RepID=H2XYM4_CIOIN